MTELRGLIFDVDGTLTENEQQGHRVAFNRAFEEAGLGWHWDESLYERLLKVFGGKERLRYFIEEFLDGNPPAEDLDAFVRDLHARKTRHYADLLAAGRLPLRPGVARLIREAHSAGLKLAIASTTTLENATRLLARTLGAHGLSWFSAFACGDAVTNKKPAPDVYLHALDQLGLAPNQCLAIEDTESGLASARGAGLAVVITFNPLTRGQDFSGAALVVDSLGEPGQPFTVLSGDAGDARLVDLQLLRRVLAGA